MDEQNGLKPDLVYEETPIMEPIVDSAPATPPKKHNGFFRNLLLFILLFGFGVWVSTQIGQFVPVNEEPNPTPFPTFLIIPTELASPSATFAPAPSDTLIPENWVSYTITGGVTYRMPPEIKAPVCDSGCISYGTNMPGGTRLTIAPRGKGQKLPDFRNAILTDASGRKFTMSLITVGDRQVYEYVGNFNGSTIGGYSFSNIRGLLVSVNDNLSIEFNHFTPLGKDADFESDDLLFTQIVGSVAIK